jgi:hypothetical protein
MRTRWITLAAALLLAAACDGSGPAGVADPVVHLVEVDPSETSVMVGDTLRLNARAKTAAGDVLNGLSVAWSNQTPGLATVLADGSGARITAVAEGTAIVTATVGGKTGQATVEISLPSSPPPPGPVASVEISADSVVIEEGSVQQLTATARDANGQVVTGRVVVWTSTDPEVVSVGVFGAVTALRAGRAAVTAKVDGASTTIPARVWTDYPYELLYAGMTPGDVTSQRIWSTELGDTARSATRVGPDVPSAGAVPSPDGSRLAYALQHPTGQRSLMVANRDGSGAVLLHVTADVGCGRMTWSPDGERIAFDCRIGDNDLDIWVVDADGGNLVNLTDAHPGRQEWPSWSPVLPDGSSRIAYAQYVNGEPQIWTMAVDGSDPRQITSGLDWQPAWSPDGSTIAFQRTTVASLGGIWLVNAAGGAERELVGGYLAGAQQAPSWSPDGRFVAFVSTPETYGSGETLVSHIYTVWADGSKLARRSRVDLEAWGPAWRLR